MLSYNSILNLILLFIGCDKELITSMRVIGHESHFSGRNDANKVSAQLWETSCLGEAASTTKRRRRAKRNFLTKTWGEQFPQTRKKRSHASQPTLHVHSVLLHSDVKQHARKCTRHATKKPRLKFLLYADKDQICPRNTEQLFSKRSDWNMKPIKRSISWISTFLFYITLIF